MLTTVIDTIPCIILLPTSCYLKYMMSILLYQYIDSPLRYYVSNLMHHTSVNIFNQSHGIHLELFTQSFLVSMTPMVIFASASQSYHQLPLLPSLPTSTNTHMHTAQAHTPGYTHTHTGIYTHTHNTHKHARTYSPLLSSQPDPFLCCGSTHNTPNYTPLLMVPFVENDNYIIKASL